MRVVGTLDAGALIAFERGDRDMEWRFAVAREQGDRFVVPAGVVGQVWRDGRRQTRLAALLGSRVIEVVPLTDHTARLSGQLCGVTGTSDIVDASVVLCARDRNRVVITSDPDDLRTLDPSLKIIPC